MNPELSDKSSELVGTVVEDRLEIRRVLGTGGMGTVYEAYHRKLDQLVAVKVLHRKLLNSSDSILRLKSEAKLAGSLNHPNLLKTYKMGFIDQDVPYIQMELVTGITLADYLVQSETLDSGLFRIIFSQCASGLQHAHERGVVHRDIKPSNIMLVDNNHVKVADFGIAKALTSETGMIQRLTQTGEMIGTPLYMSPEQCRSNKADQRSDIYSLGCVMYEALCGHPPFQSDSPFEVMMHHIEHMPPVPVSPEYSNCIMRALQKDPNARYQSMNELLSDLSDPESAKPAQPSIETKSRKRVMPMALIGSLMVVAFGSGIFWQKNHSQPKNAQSIEGLQQSIAEFQTTKDPLVKRSHRNEHTQALLDLSQLLLKKGRVAEARQSARQALAVASANEVEAPLLRSAQSAVLAMNGFPSGRALNGNADTAEMLARREKKIIDAAEESGDLETMAQSSRRAYIYAQVALDNHMEVFGGWKLASALLDLGRSEESASIMDEVLQIADETHTPIDEKGIEVAAIAKARTKHPAAAVTLFKQALELRARNKGPDALSNARMAVSAAQEFSDINAKDQALLFADKALAVLKSGERHKKKFGNLCKRLSQIYSKFGQPEKARLTNQLVD